MTWLHFRKWLFMLMALLSMALVPATPVQAQPVKAAEIKSPPMGRVSINVKVVHANHSSEVDSNLKSLMKQLTFTRFTGFKLLADYPASLAVGADASFNLVGERRLKVDLLERDSRSARIRIRMFKGKDKLLDTTVSVHRNKSFIIGGPKHRDGALVLPVTVRY